MTYLVTPQFKLSSDLMVYGRMASGYRAGGVNSGASALGLPPAYGADTTRNYEIGLKGRFFDHVLSLSLDASAFYIDWRDMQLLLVSPETGNGFFSNADRAKSQGIELSIELMPLSGMTVSAWATWNEAALTKSFPVDSDAYGVRGDRLPFGSRLSGSLSVEQELLVTGDVNAFIGCTLSYVGDRKGIFTSSAQRQTLPSYARIDFNAGVKLGAWGVNLFVNNASDKRGVINGGFGTLNPVAFTYIQPRTIGMSVARTF